MSEVILIKRNGEYRVQINEGPIRDMVISSIDVPIDMAKYHMRRITGSDNGVIYLSNGSNDDTSIRYMFKDVIGRMFGAVTM